VSVTAEILAAYNTKELNMNLSH